jgi:hypothetical protein
MQLDLVTFCSAKCGTPQLMAFESYDQMEQFANQTIEGLIDISGSLHSYDRHIEYTFLKTAFHRPKCLERSVLSATFIEFADNAIKTKLSPCLRQ